MGEGDFPTQTSVADALANARKLIATHPAQAAAQAREIIRCEPRIAESYILLSCALRALAQPAEANDAEKLGLDRAEEDPVIQRAVELLAAKEFEEAGQLIDRYLLDTPNDPVGLRLRAKFFAALGRFQEAGDILRRTLSLAPNYETAHEDVASLRGKIGGAAVQARETTANLTAEIDSEPWFTPQPASEQPEIAEDASTPEKGQGGR